MIRLLPIAAVAMALVGTVPSSGLGKTAFHRIHPFSIHFSDERTGTAFFYYACSNERGCSYAKGRTADGGRTWTIKSGARDPGEWKPPIIFVTARVAFTWEQTDSRSRLLRSDDAGASWVAQRNPCARLYVLSLSFVSPARAWMLCRIGGHGTGGDQVQAVFETRDGAGTWRRIGGTPPIIKGLELFAGGAWAWWDLAVRELATVYVSGLGKLEWRYTGIKWAESMGIESFDAISADVAYALVRREDLHRVELRRTVNRGRSWTIVHKWSFAWAYRS